jgi:hypothetical protein
MPCNGLRGVYEGQSAWGVSEKAPEVHSPLTPSRPNEPHSRTAYLYANTYYACTRRVWSLHRELRGTRANPDLHHHWFPSQLSDLVYYFSRAVAVQP